MNVRKKSQLLVVDDEEANLLSLERIFAREGFEVPERTLAVGTPAANKKALEGEAARWIERGAQDYIDLVARYREGWRVID